MRYGVSMSHWLLGSFVALAACGGGNGSSSDGAGSGQGSGSSASGSGGSGSGSSASGSSASGGYVGSGASSGGSLLGSLGDDSGLDDDGSSGSSSSGSSSSGSSSSGSGGGGSCSIPLRGALPSSDAAATTGPFTVKSYAATASVRMTNAYDVTSAHIYYPTGTPAPYASIAIVPGFVSPESTIADWGPFLASWGIVAMTIGTSDPTTGASDTSVDPDVREAALLDALVTLRDENTRSGSPLAGQLDTTRQAVAGWSMGGGGTLEAANSTPTLKAVFAMEPWNPSTTYPMDTVPTLIFAGTADVLAGPPMPQNQYMSIPSTTPKMMYEVQSGTHSVSTSPTNSATDGAPDSQSTGNVARFGLSWLKVYLECDARYRPYLLVKPSDAAEFDTTLM